MTVFVFLLLCLVLGLTVALSLTIPELLKAKSALREHAGIADFEQHKRDLLKEMQAIERRTEQLKTSAAGQEREIEARQRSLGPLDRALDLKSTADRLAATIAEYEAKVATAQKQLGEVEEAIEIQSFGFYRPRYALTSSVEYKAKLDEVRARQKELIRSDQAIHCPETWVVDGSTASGRRMVSEHSKLMLRAFNGECDASIAKVKYNNVVTLEKRLAKSFDDINKLGASKKISITEAYKEQKLEELRLVHELQEKLHLEREEQRALKEQMREEERARREIEEAQAEAEREEERREEALARARKELAESTGHQHEKLEQLVNKLEAELKDAIETKAKAIARAQLTRSGHVYVISNIGSFGEDLYKIGLTRRLDPTERVWELSSAAVPFDFDIHAMIYSEDAPALETALHRYFAHKAVNRVNPRKEFFRVSLEEIQEAVAQLHGVITFVTVPEAEDYRKTLAMAAEVEPSKVRLSLPASAAAS